MIAEEYKKQIDSAFKKIKDENIKAGIYEKASGKSEHEDFWETYIGNKLLQTGKKIIRLKGDGKPDYCIDEGKFKIHIEAKVSTKGNQERNSDLIPKGIPVYDPEKEDEYNDFSTGFIQNNEHILRFTSTISELIKKQINGSFKKSTTIGKNDKIILALNGYEVVKDLEVHNGKFVNGIITTGFSLICAVFGLNGELCCDINDGQRYFTKTEPLKRGKKIPNVFFDIGNDTPIDGIIYSNICKENLISKEPLFLFVPNPERENLSYLFPFCKNIGYPLVKV